MVIKYRGVRSLLEKLDKDGPAAKTLGFMHLDDRSLYVSSKKDILSMNRAVDSVVKTDHQLAVFHGNIFIDTSGTFLMSFIFVT